MLQREGRTYKEARLWNLKRWYSKMKEHAELTKECQEIQKEINQLENELN